MVKTKKEKFWAYGQEILKLRKRAGLEQQEVVNLMRSKKYNLKISLRNYQKSEAGEKMAYETLNNIAIFYDKYLIEVSVDYIGDVTSDTIIKKTSDIVMEEIAFMEAEDAPASKSALAKSIKEEKSTITQNCFLHKIDLYNQLSLIVKRSSKRKIYYNFHPNPPQVIAIKEFLEQINVMKFGKSKKDPFDFSREDTDDYSELDSELKSLTSLSEFGLALDKLRSFNIYLYAGNFNFYYLDMIPVDYFKMELKEVGDPNGPHDYGDFQTQIKRDNYAIYSFNHHYSPESVESSLTFSYENEWYLKKLELILSKDKYNQTDVDYEAQNAMLTYYKNAYGYTDRFIKINGHVIKQKIQKHVDDPDDFVAAATKNVGECLDSLINDNRFINYARTHFPDLSQDSPMNESPETRQQWVKTRNMGWVIQEEVENLLRYFDYSKQKVLDLMLKAGPELNETLKKARPITEEDIY